jgi:hypothetical protein
MLISCEKSPDEQGSAKNIKLLERKSDGYEIL